MLHRNLKDLKKAKVGEQVKLESPIEWFPVINKVVLRNDPNFSSVEGTIIATIPGEFTLLESVYKNQYYIKH